MALESGYYINDLVIANPLTSDPKSQGDDHIRLLKTVIKETLNGFTGSILLTATDTGTAAAHVLTPTTALVGYTPMLCLLYQPLVTNTGAVTVNVSGLGAKAIKTLAGADPTAGDLVAGSPVLLVYTGTNFITLAGAEFLSKTGSQTLTGNLTLAGNLIQTGNYTLTGNQTVSGTLAVTGATSLQAATGLTPAVGNNTTSLATTAFATAAVAAEALLRTNADNSEALLRTNADNSEALTRANADTALANTFAGYAPLISPSFTDTPLTPTAPAGTATTQIASTAFVMTQAFAAALPGQTGNAGKFVTTDGLNASWGVAGDVTLAGVQTLTNKTVEAGTFTNGYTEEVATANTSTAYTIDLAGGSVQILTLTGNCVYTFPTPVAGKSFILIQKQDATGSRTVTWPAAVKWPGATAPTLTATAAKADKFIFTAIDGSSWLGSVAGQNYTV